MSDGEAPPPQEQRGRGFGTDVSVGLPVQLLHEFTSACDAKAIRALVGQSEGEGVGGGLVGTAAG